VHRCIAWAPRSESRPACVDVLLEQAATLCIAVAPDPAVLPLSVGATGGAGRRSDAMDMQDAAVDRILDQVHVCTPQRMIFCVPATSQRWQNGPRSCQVLTSRSLLRAFLGSTSWVHG
jgi:hypothetical protein